MSKKRATHDLREGALPAGPPAPEHWTGEIAMAKEEVAASDPKTFFPVEALLARIEALELRLAQQVEASLASRSIILDQDYEAWKREAARPASERTQSKVDRTCQGPYRFRVWLDSSGDGKPGPKIDEVFPLVIPANSTHEAQALYLEIMGIRKHDYTVRAELVSAA